MIIEEGDTPGAVMALKTFLKKNQDSALVHYYLGRAEQRRDNFKGAVVSFRKAMELRPDFAQAGLALGFMYESREMNKRAAEVYKEIYETNQDVSAANRLAT